MKINNLIITTLSPFHLFLFYLLYLPSSINSVMILLNSNQKSFCALKFFNSKTVLKLSYTITGENENVVRATLNNEKNNEVFAKENENNGNFELDISEDSNYLLCFKLDTDNDCVVMFEFTNNIEQSQVIQVVKDDHFNFMNKNLTDISNIFDEIRQGLKNYAQRNSNHSKGIFNSLYLLSDSKYYKLVK